MADVANTVQEDDGLGSGIFGQPDADVAGEPEGETEGAGEEEAAAPVVDEESIKIQEFIKKYTGEDGGLNVTKLAKEAMHAQRLIGQKGQEVGELKKKAEDLDNLLNYVNSDPKALKAWNKLLAGDLEEGGTKAPVASSEDLDKRLVEEMRAGKIAGPIKTVVKAFLEENKLLEQVEGVKKKLATSEAERAQAARNANACKFLATLEAKGWTQNTEQGHYFKDAELDAEWVKLYNQGHDPENAFFIAKGKLGIEDVAATPNPKKKAAMLGTEGKVAKTAASKAREDDDEWALWKQGMEEQFGPDITKSRT